MVWLFERVNNNSMVDQDNREKEKSKTGKFNSGHFKRKKMSHGTRQIRKCETKKNEQSLYMNKRNYT